MNVLEVRPIGAMKRHSRTARFVVSAAGAVLALSGVAIAAAPAAQAAACGGGMGVDAGGTGGSGQLGIGCVYGPSDPDHTSYTVTIGNTTVSTDTAGTWTESPLYAGHIVGEWTYDYSCLPAGTLVSATGGGAQLNTYPSPLTIPDNGPLPASCTVFIDVPPGIQFYAEINWLASAGISTGWDEGNGTKTYRPFQSINRDAMAAFLYRSAGSPTFTAPATSPFTDVSTSNQFYKEITWLASTGISTGWDEGNGTKTFRPLTAVNRDAMAAFLYRSAGSPAFAVPGTSPFTDVAISNQFYKEISWLASTGVSTGWDEGNGTKSFRPVTAVKRDAMAAFLYRFQNLGAN